MYRIPKSPCSKCIYNNGYNCYCNRYRDYWALVKKIKELNRIERDRVTKLKSK